MNGLSGWAKILSKDWIAEARKVLEVQQALDVSYQTRFQSRFVNSKQVIATEARLQSLRVE
jgi:MICOS complex subunit MIC60